MTRTLIRNVRVVYMDAELVARRSDKALGTLGRKPLRQAPLPPIGRLGRTRGLSGCSRNCV